MLEWKSFFTEKEINDKLKGTPQALHVVWGCVVILIIIALLWLCCGCTGRIVRPQTFILPETEVQVWDSENIRKAGPNTIGRVLGWAFSDRIATPGRFYKGKLYFEKPSNLGHEIWHILHDEYPDLIWDPDEL
jgi:hypothetical protein